MTPKKAIIIVLVLFLIMTMVFTFLYLKKQLTVPDGDSQIDVSTNLIDRQASSSVQQKIKDIETKTNEQVEKIVEQGRTDTGGITVDAQKRIDEVVNQEIIEKKKLRTPEQVKADEQRWAEQLERDWIINEQIINQQKNQ